MLNRVGQQLGNYRLILPLGKGSFAEVYLGEHVYLRSQAAIKVLHTLVTPEDMESFLTEARHLSRLVHPHIIRVLEFGVEGNTPFLVMDYAPNGSLRQHPPKGTPLPVATIVGYVKQVADALQYAHNEKVIHRDIKPENMLLGRRNEVLLSDFGIAIVAQSTHSLSTQNMAGTIAYMAPEQILAHPRSASDQYALGVVVYEWLSGAPPFHGSFYETTNQHLHVPPPSLHEKIPTIPPQVEQVVMTALEKDPHKRFASVRAFATAFEQAWELPELPSASANVLATANQSPVPAQTIDVMPDFASSPSVQFHNTSTSSPPSSQLVSTQPPISTSPHGGGFLTRKAVILIGLVLLVIAGSIGLFSPILIKRAITLKPSPSGIHTYTTPCVTTHSSLSNNYMMFGFNPQHTSFVPNETRLSPTNVSHLMPCWTASTNGQIYSSPAVVNGVVYVGSHDHKLYAFNAITGAVLWTASTGDEIWSSPAVVNGIVYIGSSDDKLYAFNAMTGAQLWTAPTGGDVYTSSPTVANGVVYVGTLTHMLYAFNATTGAQLWVAYSGDFIRSSPSVANGIVYVGSRDRKLYAFNARTGAKLWTALIGDSAFSSPAVANEILYVGSRDRKLYAFDARTGARLWAAPTGGDPCSSPAVANGIVYVGSRDDKLYAFDARTGARLWAAPTGGGICSSPAVANEVVYVGSTDHKLYAFDARTGAQLWTASTNSFVYSSPAVANGIVYVGSYDMKLYAFYLPDKNQTS